ncbi:MAG: glycine/betaine ABC transporter substrate-binding protein [Clostridium sp.]|nr:glycine/betaine ABC transporter substrate-binding protein [Clostridium sp.]
MNFLKNSKKFILGGVAMVLALSFAACSGGSKEGTIVVGGKDYTEQDVLVHLVSEIIEDKTDYDTDRKPYLGGTSVVVSSIKSGDVDVMVDYTGTGLIDVLKRDPMKNPDEVLEVVQEGYDKEYDIKWFDPIGFNNTYAITMRREMAEDMGIEKLSDLPEYASDFTFAAVQEFLEREDGYDGMSETYGFEFGDVKAMDPGLSYTALKDEQADISVSFGTDGRVPAFDFKIIEDDKNFFPPYNASVVARNDTLENNPGLEEALETLKGAISDEEMAKMNSRVDIDKDNPKDVAREWLIENNLIEE